MGKKKRYYEVTDSHPASWLFGPLVLSEKDIQEMRRNGLERDVRIRLKPEGKPPKK